MFQLKHRALRGLFLFAFLFASLTGHAVQYFSKAPGGPWIFPSTWQGGVVPLLTDTVIINHKVILTLDWGLDPGGSITINSGGSLEENIPGRAFLQQGGTITNNGTIDISIFIITGGELINNDSIRFNQNFYSAGTVNNNGIITDVDSVWIDGIFSNIGPGGEMTAELFYNTDSIYNSGLIGFLEGANEGIITNDGMVVCVLFYNDGEFENNGASSLNAVDLWNDALLINNGSASVNVSRDFLNGDSLFPISGPLVYNDGFFGVGRNWYNADSIIGVTGQFCIGQLSLNWGYIGGTIDICDNTGGGIDLSTGPNAFIEPTVTNCTSGSCAMVVAVEEIGPTCSGGTDGIIALSPYGGSGIYTYEWDDGNTADSLGGLAEGVYIIVVSDGTDSTVVVVDLNTPEIFTLVSSTESSCGLPNGTAGVSAFNGTSPYTYLWDDPNGQTNATATGLFAGSYSVIITDNDSCSITDVIQVVAKAGLTASTNITEVTCLSDSNGIIDITVTGGTPPYDYAWFPDVSTGSLAVDIEAGDYTIIITDADACTVTVNASVTSAGGPDCIDWKIFSGITPNGDGIDDFWEIRGLKQYDQVGVQIFNNRGIVIWESDQYENDWDGTNQDGDILIEGVYYYVVTRPDEIDRGWVHIVR